MNDFFGPGGFNHGFFLAPVPSGILFYTPLLTTVAASVGSVTPAFTRATIATVTDFEGLIKTVKSGEVRFQGARRVENLLTATATLSTQDVTVNAGTYVFSMGACTGSVSFTGAATGSLAGSATQRKSTTLTTTAGTLTITVTGTVSQAQLEDATGQANQNPSEYISAGTLSSPFHGVMVDGVKYFSYRNGNTVASNVVTEANGEYINDYTLKGFVCEAARTNNCLRSNDFNNGAWIKSNVTVNNNTTVSLDGYTLADDIMETIANGTHIIRNISSNSDANGIIVTADTIYNFSCYLKLKTDGRSVIRLNFLTTALNSGFYADFNVSTGAIATAISTLGTGTGTRAAITSIGNGWYRCEIAGKIDASSTRAAAVIQMTNDAGGTSYIGDTAKGVIAWGAQVELGSFCSSYVPTTTATVARNNDALTYAIASNVLDTIGSSAAEIQWLTAPATVGANGNILSGTTGVILQATTAGTGAVYDGTNTLTGGTITDTLKHYLSSNWTTTTQKLCVDGGTIESETFDGNMNIGTTITVGDTDTFMTIRNIETWVNALSDNALQDASPALNLHEITPASYTPVWSELFSIGSLDTTKWAMGYARHMTSSYRAASGQNVINNELQGYPTDNSYGNYSFLSDGGLEIIAKSGAYTDPVSDQIFNYTSAIITTVDNSDNFTLTPPFYIEARGKAAWGQGLLSAILWLHDNSYNSNAEIDLNENPGARGFAVGSDNYNSLHQAAYTTFHFHPRIPITGGPYAEGITSLTLNPATFTVSGTTVTLNGSYGLYEGLAVKLDTTGVLPAVTTSPALDNSTTYYIKTPAAGANTCSLARTSGGAALSFTGGGTGTHTLGPVIPASVSVRFSGHTVSNTYTTANGCNLTTLVLSSGIITGQSVATGEDVYLNIASTQQLQQGNALGHNAESRYRNYGVKVTTTGITFYIDGSQVYTCKNHNPNVTWYVLMTLAVGGDWPGNPDYSTGLPKSQITKFIKAYTVL